jgi:diaminopimelate decarboxylase
VVDHLDEIAVLQSLAPPYGIRPQILIRLAPNIDPHTHRYLTTGVADSKFGLRIQDGTAEAAARAILDADAFDLVGLHFHIGSQVFDIAALGAALETVLDAAADWHARFGFNFRELDIGGGWGVAYDETQTSLDIEAFAAHTTRTLRAGLHARGLNEHLKLLVEPGRGLIARAGVALYRIGVRKEIPGVRRYVAVDGGIGDNLRPALYGAHYQAYLANRMADAAVYDYTIAGRYCEQGDVLIESTPLPEPCIGDLVAIPVAGAYQLPMASNYNLIPRPAVVRVGDGAAQLVRRRETLQDLLAADVEV